MQDEHSLDLLNRPSFFEGKNPNVNYLHPDLESTIQDFKHSNLDKMKQLDMLPGLDEMILEDVLARTSHGLKELSMQKTKIRN